jgi:CBS domain containing-hemolysin-like protein
MSIWLIIFLTLAWALLSLFFSTLTYSLREFSRSRLDEQLERRGKGEYLNPTVEHSSDLVFVTAFLRLLSNMGVLLSILSLFQKLGYPGWAQYFLAVLLTGGITLFLSVAVPHAVAAHAAEPLIASFVGLLHALRRALSPITKLMHATDKVVAKATTNSPAGNETASEKMESDIEQEILSVVEEGEKEGVVDEQEREMIERVIAFHDTQVGQIMTPRPEIFAIELHGDLDRVKEVIAESGHSRIPVYDGTLDHVAGILYARDLTRLVGESAAKFDLRASLRPPLFVPETKLLRDLLRDFTLHKVHIAIVSDEYGGTSGLITIEDIFEELVGEISDEHEPEEPAMLKRIDDQTVEADGRVPIEELNRVLGLNLPEEAGYETLAGFVSTTVGRIPEPGATFEYEGTRYVVVDAEPQRVNRVRIEMAPQPVEKTS